MHGVHHQPFFAHYAQQGGGRIGLDRIVHAETGVFGKPHKVAATLPQHVLIVYIERGAKGFSQLAGGVAAIKIAFVGVRGADIGHKNTSEIPLKDCVCRPNKSGVFPLRAIADY